MRVPRASTTRLLANALGLNGSDREAFIGACHRNLARERSASISACGSGLRGDVPGRVRLNVHALVRRNEQSVAAVIPASSGQLPLTVEITASLRLAGTGTGTSALVLLVTSRVTSRSGNERPYGNIRGFGNIAENQDTPDCLNAPATACDTRAATRIGALVANSRHNGQRRGWQPD